MMIIALSIKFMYTLKIHKKQNIKKYLIKKRENNDLKNQ